MQNVLWALEDIQDVFTIPTLRPYQENAVETLFWNYYEEGMHNMLIEMPTGSGKTLVLSTFLSRFLLFPWQEALILVPSLDLVQQTLKTLLLFFPRHEIGVMQGDAFNECDRRITLASLDTLCVPKRLKEYLRARKRYHSFHGRPGTSWEGCSTIIIDECHVLGYEKILDQIKGEQTCLVGFSATPYRSDGRSLVEWFRDGVVYSVDFFDLILMGHLLQIEHLEHAIACQITDKDLEELCKETVTITPELRKKALTQNRLDILYQEWHDKASHLRTVLYAYDKIDAWQIAKRFQDEGVNVRVIVAETKGDDRQTYYDQLVSREVPLIINVGVMTTGLDIPGIECIMMARFVKFLGLFTQIVGRGMRPAPGKEHLLVLGFPPENEHLRHQLMTMGTLIGFNGALEKTGSVKRALEMRIAEEAEFVLPEFERGPDAPTLTLEAKLQRLRQHASSLFTGNGWIANVVTRGYSRDCGEYGMLQADNFGTGYLVSHTIKGKTTRLTEQAMPAELALGKGNQHIRRLEETQKTKKKQQAPDRPISEGELKYLLTRKVYIQKADQGQLTYGEYLKAQSYLKKYGGAFPKNELGQGGHVVYSRKQGFFIHWYDQAPASSHNARSA